MSQFRIKRINEQVKRELSDLIRKHLPVEKYGLISVTEVDVAKDLKTATIYISAVGIAAEGDNAIDALKEVRKTLQAELARKIIIKYTPRLFFRKDTGMERGQHMVELLESLGESPEDEGQKT